MSTATAPTHGRAPGPAPTTSQLSGSADVPAAVAAPVVDLVTGPLRSATVVAVHRAAVALCCDDLEERTPVARIVTILTAEASGVPNGIRTALRLADRPFAAMTTSTPAFVGAGRVEMPGLRLRAVRREPTRVPIVQPAADRVSALAMAASDAPQGLPDGPVDALRAGLASGDAGELRSAVRGLVGLGQGSTPGGDDVLCGVLAGLHATERMTLAHQVAVAAMDDVAVRTTAVSANFLMLAAAGHACAEARAVLRAVASTANSSSLGPALAGLLRLGHTSGADLATGLAMGLAVPTQPEPRTPRFAARPRRAASPSTR